jgi:hypothetical protein
MLSGRKLPCNGHLRVLAAQFLKVLDIFIVNVLPIAKGFDLPVKVWIHRALQNFVEERLMGVSIDYAEGAEVGEPLVAVKCAFCKQCIDPLLGCLK